MKILCTLLAVTALGVLSGCADSDPNKDLKPLPNAKITGEPVNKSAAQQAIAATLSQCGVGSIALGIASLCPSGNLLNDSGMPRVLNMTDFAINGLTSPALDFGGVCPTGYGCAFSGINPKGPSMPIQYPIGFASW